MSRGGWSFDARAGGPFGELVDHGTGVTYRLTVPFGGSFHEGDENPSYATSLVRARYEEGTALFTFVGKDRVNACACCGRADERNRVGTLEECVQRGYLVARKLVTT